MKILVSGSTGLIGSSLVPFLASLGHVMSALVRKPGRHGVRWDPQAGTIDVSHLAAGFDAVIHLAGESIASGRWTPERKREIRDSRVKGTRLLAETLAQLSEPPKTLICASAIGYYGNRGEEVLQEYSASGTGFLAETCREWEAATAPAAAKGIRVVHLRSGVILSARGGALAKMLLPFKLGLGGPIGSGQQYMSWVALDDMVGAISHLLNSAVSGPVNIVSPNPVTNRVFTTTLGHALSRPTLLPMPVFAAKLAFGEMADEMLLASQRVEPHVLSKSGYTFQYPDLEGAFRHVLSNN
jgi:uncharacterized protein